jgi:nucleoside-diphosphate-sugar epimerase
MQVLLTGAFGNVGRYTIDALLDEGHAVVAFDLDTPRSRKAAARLDPRVRVVFGDLTDRRSLAAALDGADAVVHLAAILPPTVDRAPALARRVNVDATLDLIALMEASPTARRLVFASSTAIFGDVQDREPPLRAETPTAPTEEYGRTKVACERAIRESGLRWSILRLGVAVPTRLLGAGAPFDLRAGFEISADARIEIVHPADAGTAFARAVACEAAIGKVLFIGGGEKCQLTHAAFFNDLMGAIGIGAIPAEAFVRKTVPQFLGDWLDTDESQRLLHYQSRGLGELKADLRKDLGHLTTLVRLLRPLATGFMLRNSPYLKENRRARR